jgi:hypothetical protein
MVLAIVGENNPGLEQVMEENVVSSLKHKGYNANSYFDLYGPKALDKTDEQGAIKQLRANGEDAILTIVLLDTAKEHHYVPGSVTYAPYPYYYRFWGYYSNLYGRIYTPGYYTTDTRYFWETNLYSAGSEDLLYSVRTEAFDPTSAKNLANKYGKLIVKDMTDKGVIRPL